MGGKTPLDTIERLVMAINQRDLDNAVSLYEPTGVLVAEPGKVARGASEIKEALKGFLSLRPTLTTIKHELIQVGDSLFLGLETSWYRLSQYSGGDGREIFRSLAASVRWNLADRH